jgi:hypothetical protein
MLKDFCTIFMVINSFIGAGDPRCKIAITLVRSEGSEKNRCGIEGEEGELLLTAIQ